MTSILRYALISVLSALVSCTGNPSASDLEEGFLNPPDSCKPWVWWHWLNGNISETGITRDLEAMAAQGIGGATIFNLQRQAAEGPVTYGSEKWQQCITHAFAEAKRLGLELSFQNCGGWATNGGPWVTRDHAMKKLTWKKQVIHGPMKFSAVLKQPASIENYYRDVRILAYPSENSEIPDPAPPGLSISCDREMLNKESMTDGDILSESSVLADGGRVTLLFEFSDPLEASSVFFKRTWPAWNGINNFQLSVSPDNETYSDILEDKILDDYQLFKFNPVKARFYKIVIDGGFQDILRIPEIQFNRDINDFLPALNNLNALAGFQVREKVSARNILNRAKKPVEINDIMDLTANLNQDGVLDWNVPAGTWTLLRIGYTLTGRKNDGPAGSTGFESDKLSAEATGAYFEGMKNVFLRGRGEYVGKTLKTITMDSWEALNLNWTKNFPDEFARRRSYSIFPFLPVIAGELVENDDVSYRFLWDFRRTIADLLADHHFGEMARLCRQSGLRLEVEAAGAQQAMKDPINYSSKADIPMTEFWVQPFKPNGSFMDAVSGGHLYDRKVISAESFTSPAGDWQLAPPDLKTYGDQAFCWGINSIKFHSYTHQPDETRPGWQMNPWGIAFNRKLPWWDHASGYLKYLQRTQHLLQQGQFKADVLLFYSEGAQTDLNSAYQNRVLSYLPRGYKFDGCDQNTLLNRLSVRDNQLILPNGAAYRLLVLPENLQNTPALLEKIKELVGNGAMVYGPKPVNSPSLMNYPDCDSSVKILADEIWGNGNAEGLMGRAYGKGRVVFGIPVGKVLEGIILPDFEYSTERTSDSLDFIHRKYGDSDIYFVANLNASPVHATCRFRMTGKIAELWDPETGAVYRNIKSEDHRKFTSVTLTLPSRSSVFVIFRSAPEVAPVPVDNPWQPDGATATGQLGLPGPWMVTFDKEWGGPGEVRFDTLVSWTDRPEEGIRYFSGKATYQKDFMLDGLLPASGRKIILDLGTVKATARVRLNGKVAGTLWKAPFIIDLSGFLNAGQNSLQVEVANSWPNRIIGDLNSSSGIRYTWSNSTDHYRKDSGLTPSGLIGPVTIRAFSVGQH